MNHRPRLLLPTLLLCAGALGAQTPATKSTAEDSWRSQFQAGKTPLGRSMAAPTPSPVKGKVTYTLHQPKEPTDEEAKIFAGIKEGMDRATEIYNTHTRLKKALNVFYSPGTPTADGNINGSIRLGRHARNARVCMHEICHTVGIGTHHHWGRLMVDKRWQGKRANKLLQELTGDPQAQLHGDHMHFWPYGLNYDNEVKSDEDLIRHARLVEAMVQDLEETK